MTNGNFFKEPKVQPESLIKEVPFNWPGLKEFSLAKHKILIAQADPKWKECPILHHTDEYWKVSLTHKGQVYASAKAQFQGADCGPAEESDFWQLYHKQAGFPTGTAWYVAFRRMHHGQTAGCVYFIRIYDIEEEK